MKTSKEKESNLSVFVTMGKFNCKYNHANNLCSRSAWLPLETAKFFKTLPQAIIYSRKKNNFSIEPVIPIDSFEISRTVFQKSLM